MILRPWLTGINYRTESIAVNRMVEEEGVRECKIGSDGEIKATLAGLVRYLFERLLLSSS